MIKLINIISIGTNRRLEHTRRDMNFKFTMTHPEVPPLQARPFVTWDS